MLERKFDWVWWLGVGTICGQMDWKGKTCLQDVWYKTHNPLMLLDGVFAIYQQLGEKERADINWIKSVLYMAFGMDGFCGIWAIHWVTGLLLSIGWHSCKILAVFFSRMSDCGLACVFISGLPDQVKWLLRISTWMEGLAIDQLLARTWAILKDEVMEKSLEVAVGRTIQDGTKKLPTKASMWYRNRSLQRS